MAYSAVGDSGRDYGRENGFRPPDGYSNSGNGEFRKKIGSMEHATNVDSPNQVLVSLIRLLLKVEVFGTFVGADCCMQSVSINIVYSVRLYTSSSLFLHYGSSLLQKSEIFCFHSLT